jgi:hypothetical protein
MACHDRKALRLWVRCLALAGIAAVILNAWAAGSAAAEAPPGARTTASHKRPRISGEALPRAEKGQTNRRTASADLTWRDEPALPPPARIDSDALERARPSRPAAIARPSRTLWACPGGAAEPHCRHGSLQEVLDAALPSDRVVLAPGVYAEGAIIGTPDLVLRGEPGAHLRGHPVEGKAALVVKARGVVIEGIECSGIVVPDNNGACIRIEGDDLTVRDVHFHDNQQGILSGPGGGVLVVENSLLERNGFGGRAHGVYIGKAVETFIFRNNRILATTGAGHGLKSRARRTVIENNVIAGLDGRDSRAIDLPNGGEVVIRDNVLQKGPNSDNVQMIGLALEGGLHAVNEALIEGNLLLFDTRPTGLVQSLGQALGLIPAKGTAILTKSPGPVVFRHNTIVGARAIGDGVIKGDNRNYESRRDAGLPPYPALPDSPQ